MKLVVREEQLRRRKQRPRRVAAQEPEARFAVAPELGDRRLDASVQAYRRVLRKIVGDRRRAVEEERQVVLDPAGHHTVADIAVERRLRGIALEYFAEAAAEPRASGLVLREFSRRQQADARHRIDAALRIDVEALDRFDRVVEEIDAVRQSAAHREKVD